MTLIPPYDDGNIFAKILRGELPKISVYEDASTLAFMDIFPQSEGHTLVIPKHARAVSLIDAEPEALGPLIGSVQRIAKAIVRTLGPDGVRIVQFNGAAAGQTVFHLHFHVIPVYADQTERPHAAGAKADPEKLRALATRIASAIE